MGLRVQKYLAQLGLCSRREAETWIREGRVKINGETLAEQGRRIDPGCDVVSLDQKIVRANKAPHVYWLYHKPDETLSSRKSQGDKKTIYDTGALARVSFFVPAVGRLDYRTEGLLVLTNDGALGAKIAHPSAGLPRHYHALVSRRLTDEEELKVASGFKLDDGDVGKIFLHYIRRQKIGRTHGYWYSVTVHEGRNRLVRRIFESFSARVIRLVRYGYGDLRLTEELKPGQYRQLTKKEIAHLRHF